MFEKGSEGRGNAGICNRDIKGRCGNRDSFEKSRSNYLGVVWFCSR